MKQLNDANAEKKSLATQASVRADATSAARPVAVFDGSAARLLVVFDGSWRPATLDVHVRQAAGVRRLGAFLLRSLLIGAVVG